MQSRISKDRERVLTGQMPFISLGTTRMLPAAPVTFFEESLDPTFGTEAWARSVFESAPAGEGWSRSRMTHRHQILIKNKYIPVEGYENLAGYVLNYFYETGKIVRWKPQPYVWQIEKDGTMRVPDFLVELPPPPPRYVIIQVKSARFMTVQIEREFSVERFLAKERAVEHVVWTDKKPLDGQARNLFFRLRGARLKEYHEEELNSLVSAVFQAGSRAALDLVNDGHDPSLLPIAIQQGKLFVDLRRPLNEKSVISSHPITDAREFLLCAWADPTSWWNSLPSAQD